MSGHDNVIMRFFRLSAMITNFTDSARWAELLYYKKKIGISSVTYFDEFD